MAVSNSTDAKSTAVEIIIAARELLGISADEEPLESIDLQRGLSKLTKMLKTWEADGIGSWILTEGSMTLVASTPSYLFGAGGTFTTVPFEVTDARINRGGNDIPMTRLERTDYFDLPNKTATGYPSCWYYDRQRDNGTLYVWPSPDASAGTFKFTYRRRIMDLDVATDNFDVPPEWEEAIENGLAKRLIPIYGLGGTPEAQQVILDAERLYQAVKSFDFAAQEGVVSIVPAGFGRGEVRR